MVMSSAVNPCKQRKAAVLAVLWTSTLLLLPSPCDGAFVTLQSRLEQKSSIPLFMGKGFNKGNKQAELARKMKLAKQQKEGVQQGEGEKKELSAEEIKERNDRLRFEELLERGTGNVLSNYAKDGYLSQAQEEEEITAARSGVDRLFEGDPAPTEPFEDLVVPISGNALGKGGAARLTGGDYLIILTDPRSKSSELRLTLKSLESSLPKDVRSKLIVVNADTPAENRRWMKKNGVNNIQMFSDEKMDFLRTYTALGENRWAMCMFIIGDERIQKLAREVDPMVASRVILNAVKTLNI